MPHYEKLLLSDCAALITPGRSPSTLGLQYREAGIACIGAEAITEFGTIDADRLVFVDEEMNERVPKSEVRANDLLVTISNARQVKSIVISDRHLPANVNATVAVIRLRPQLLSPHFLHYYIAAATIMSEENCVLSRLFNQNRNIEQLGSCEIPLPLISTQTDFTRDLVDCDHAISKSVADIHRVEFELRQSMDQFFGVDDLNPTTGEDELDREIEDTHFLADQDCQTTHVSLDQIMEAAKIEKMGTTAETRVHPGQVLAWHDDQLLAIAETDPAQSRTMGLRAKVGDAVIISTKPSKYYLAAVLIECIAPPASLVLRTIKADCEFLCLHALFSRAFVQHAIRIAAETKNLRPQWKFIRKYKIRLPSEKDLEKANSSLQPIYCRWTEAVQMHITLKKRRTELLMRFWDELHPAR